MNEPIKIPRIKSPVVLDGLSNESAWEGIQPLSLLMRRQNFGSKLSERTEILLGYDDDYLYQLQTGERISTKRMLVVK